MMVDLDYVHEKLMRATEMLAASEALLHERLEMAWYELEPIPYERMAPFFPDEHEQELVRRIYEGLDEGVRGARNLESNEGIQLASHIVSLYDTAARRMETLED